MHAGPYNSNSITSMGFVFLAAGSAGFTLGRAHCATARSSKPSELAGAARSRSPSAASLAYAGSRSVLKQVEAVGSRPPCPSSCVRRGLG